MCNGECVLVLAAYKDLVEKALINWLRQEPGQHKPSCGYGRKGDLVRWTEYGGLRFPTIRDDMVDAVVERKIHTPSGELVEFLVIRMSPEARGYLTDLQVALS